LRPGGRHWRMHCLLFVWLAAPTFALAEAPPGAISCLGCHPRTAADGPISTLSGRVAADIISAMEALKTGARQSTVMDRIARGFSDEEIRDIAEWYESRPAGGPAQP